MKGLSVEDAHLHSHLIKGHRESWLVPDASLGLQSVSSAILPSPVCSLSSLTPGPPAGGACWGRAPGSHQQGPAMGPTQV